MERAGLGVEDPQSVARQGDGSTMTKRQRRCYLVVAYAPSSMSVPDANVTFNAFIAEPRNGLALFHDHFVGTPGGVAILSVETADQLAALPGLPALRGWEVRIHPLIFSDSAVRFLYQIDFTMTVYRAQRLRGLMKEYEGTEYARRLNEPPSKQEVQT